jgi:hypothetical protein
VHGEERVGVLGRDSLGDKYILERTTTHTAMQSTVFGVQRPGALSEKSRM